MNALAFQRLKPNATFPWFDEYSESKTFCKVYNDGSAYVAIPQGRGPKKKQHKGASLRSSWDYLFDELYAAALREEVKDIQAYIKAGFEEAYPEVWGIDEFIAEKLAKLERNLWVRKKRFRRKAYLNEWNYFVTFTYSDEKHDEESFKKSLRKCLSNLHSRRGWTYMGVWERSPEEKRLHFHCIMNVPDGQMIGKIFERRDYSTKQHKMVLTHPNDFFEERFGRCDFEKISSAQLRHGNTLGYILKYLEKTNERIVYSRGIPTEFFMNVRDDDIVAEMIDYVLKYVLFDDVVDYEFNVLHKPKVEYYYYETPLPS